MENRSLLQNIRTTAVLSVPVLILSKLLAIALPIAQVVIGQQYLEKCPRQPNIPIYLLVSGVFGLVLALLSCLPCAREDEHGSSGSLSSLCTAWNSLVTLFLFIWFISGNVWVYSIYPPNYDTSAVDYCAKTVYLFAFWTINAVYILLGILLVGGCCLLFCMCLLGKAINNTRDEV
ncbi:transmembrane protein 272-like [Brachyhypopomus gauderio]|uniref:transmembrane protein 272-like n=1 Tax=Brachyhypopomus gauderio TaxID=698409 RepID=UPI00404194C5